MSNLCSIVRQVVAKIVRGSKGDESVGPYNIPDELITEILCYVPVKSLIRLTIVCKTWLRLIKDDHRFAMKNYLTRMTSSSRVLDNSDYITLVRSCKTPLLYYFTREKSTLFSKEFHCSPHESIGISNSCHGIICFHFFGRNEILLCNPSIQEVVLLPPCPPTTTYNGKKALGFDPIQNDYKVVAIDFPSRDNYLCTVNLYSLRHGHWRNLYVSTPPRCTLGLKDDGASNANGRIYNWLINKEVELGKSELTMLSFDMREEVLKEFPLPKCEQVRPHIHDHQLLSSTRWQACVSCINRSYYFSCGFIDVWVLKDWIWSKAIVVNFPDHNPMRPSNFWINDKELYVNVQKGNITQVCHYDLGTKRFKQTGSTGKLRSTRGYMESLVSLKRFIMSPNHECKHGEDEDEDLGLKHKDKGVLYVLSEVTTEVRAGLIASTWFKHPDDCPNMNWPLVFYSHMIVPSKMI